MSVRAYVGTWGSGKTLALARECAEKQKEGFEVYTNFGFKGGFRVHTMEEVLDLCVLQDRVPRFLAWDEMGMLLPARQASAWPAALNTLWLEGRKLGFSVSYTAQAFDLVDKNVRRLTTQVVSCRGWGRVLISARKARPREYRPLFFTFAHYEGATFGTGQQKRNRFEIKAFPKAIAALYDTYYLIESVQACLREQREAMRHRPTIVFEVDA